MVVFFLFLNLRSLIISATLLAELKNAQEEDPDEEAASLLANAHRLYELLGLTAAASVNRSDAAADGAMSNAVCEEDDEEEAVSDAWVDRLLFALLRRLSYWKPTVIILEDAHFLDEG